MKKKNRNLMILLVVLVILGGSYIGVVIYKDVQEQKQQDASAAEEEANKIVLNQMDSVARISFPTSEGELAFTYHDDAWHYEADESFPLNTSKLNLIQNNLNPLEATRKLEEKEDLANYGLAEPAKTVTIADASGNQKVLKIGNVNEYTGDYYVSIEGDDNVYTIGSSLVSSLDVTLNDLIQLDTLPSLSESNITQIEWKTNSDDVIYKKEERIKETEEAKSSEDSSETESETASSETSTETVWTETRNGTTADLSDSSKITNAMSTITQLSVNSSENYNVNEEQLPSYGLDEANRRDLIITYNDTTSENQESKTITLHIGSLSAQESSYYCVRLDDSQQVSRIAAFNLDSIIGNLEQVGEPTEVTVPESE